MSHVPLITRGSEEVELAAAQLRAAVSTRTAAPTSSSPLPGDYRRRIFNWFKDTSKNLGHSQHIYHQSMTLFDAFLSRRAEEDAPRSDALRRIGTACLSLTIKLNGTPDDLGTFHKAFRPPLDRALLRRDEMEVLIELDWSVNLETPASFLHLLLALDPSRLVVPEFCVPEARNLVDAALSDAFYLAVRPETVAFLALNATLLHHGLCEQPLYDLLGLCSGLEIPHDAGLLNAMLAYLQLDDDRDSLSVLDASLASASPITTHEHRPLSRLSLSMEEVSSPAAAATLGAISHLDDDGDEGEDGDDEGEDGDDEGEDDDVEGDGFVGGEEGRHNPLAAVLSRDARSPTPDPTAIAGAVTASASATASSSSSSSSSAVVPSSHLPSFALGPCSRAGSSLSVFSPDEDAEEEEDRI